ncbi:MAG: hypothetical protein GX442_25545 [Candidatus Riflebacteria bacterium]|nr:hypothetical protein [Candidatus Riflebacteria bacterium]
MTGPVLALAVLAVGSLAAVLSVPPIPQNQLYHLFADARVWLGIPNAADVLTNLAFLVPGLLGLFLAGWSPPPGAVWSWRAVFGGSLLVAFGSGFYHWRPEDWTLVWDRLPMTISFMGLFAVMLCEYVWREESERLVLPPLLAAGLGSVVWWYGFDDLRVYLWVQFFPLACLLLVPALFPARYSQGWKLFLALGLYALGKVVEVHDRAVFAATGNLVSGHSLKHLLAGLGAWVLYVWLRDRQPLPAAPPVGEASPLTSG